MKQFFKTGRALGMAAMLAWLWPSAGWSQPASFAETNAFGAALNRFQLEFWPQAEAGFREFAKKYTNSPTYVPAVLFEAQAIFRQQRYDDVIRLLGAEQARAGKAADQFAFWTASAQLAGGKFGEAAAGFARITREFPESDRCDDAAYFEAEARFGLQDWPGVIHTLQDPGGAFQKIVAASPASEFVLRGLLLLGRAELRQKNYAEAEATLRDLAGRSPDPQAEWNRLYLLGQVQLGSGDMEAALQTSTNLLAAAAKAGRPADSAFFQAEVYEHLDRLTEAVTVYESLAATDLPVETRQRAIWRIVDLQLRQNRLDPAAAWLQKMGTNSDLALLTLGELSLKRFELGLEAPAGTNVPPAVADTNLLLRAGENFTQLLTNFAGSPFLGQAQLDLGWCLLEEGKIAESGAAFSLAATNQLLLPEARAEAQFKLADVQFQQTNLTAAVASYRAIVDEYAALPSIRGGLLEQALYQVVRGSLALNDTTTATNAMANLLARFPTGPTLARSMLLLGQGYNRLGRSAWARGILQDFETRFPDAEQLPEVKLAIARTFELEADWPAAITNYEGWISLYTNHAAVPRAVFSLAWANAAAGRETNALAQFNSFLTLYPTNEQAALAQWWVGACYMRQGDYLDAERSFKDIYQNRPESELRYEAGLMAGRAAVGRNEYGGAMSYFTNLTMLRGCPLDLVGKAQFAYGDALIAAGDPTSTNRSLILGSYSNACNNFASIARQFPTNRLGIQAVGRMGDCHLQLAALEPAAALAHYVEATNDYQQVINSSPLATVKERSQAACGLATVLVKMGRLLNDPKLLDSALERYLDVVDGRNLQEGETQELDWVAKAGADAGALAEDLKKWGAARNLYQKLGVTLPSMKEVFLKKQRNAEDKLAAANPKNQ